MKDVWTFQNCIVIIKHTLTDRHTHCSSSRKEVNWYFYPRVCVFGYVSSASYINKPTQKEGNFLFFFSQDHMSLLKSGIMFPSFLSTTPTAPLVLCTGSSLWLWFCVFIPCGGLVPPLNLPQYQPLCPLYLPPPLPSFIKTRVGHKSPLRTSLLPRTLAWL